MDYGVLAIVPPILAVILAIVTKRVVPSLMAAGIVGATIMSGWNPIDGVIMFFNEYTFNAVGNHYNGSTIMVVLLCGALGALLEKGGGAYAFANALSTKIKNARQAQVLASVGGTAIFFSDSANPVLVGPIFRPVTDKFNVSREKLAYIADSTTAPIPSLLPITGWGTYIISLLVAGAAECGYTEMSGFNLFLNATPFAFYSIGAVLMVYLISASGLDFGPMKKAELRARSGEVLRKTGKAAKLKEEFVLPEGAHPTALGMILPIVALIVVVLGTLLYMGGFPGVGIMTAIENGHVPTCLCFGFTVAIIIAAVFAVKSKVLDIEGVFSTMTAGFGQMAETIMILAFAWSLGEVCGSIGTSSYIVGLVGDVLTPAIFYPIMFVIGAFCAFATGSSWGTWSIFMPIAMSLGMAIGANVPVACGVVLSAGMFGDHCSPISDTTVLSSMGSNCDHFDHFTTQLPYALTVGAGATLAYLILGLMNASGLAMAVAGIVLTMAVPVVVLVLTKMKDKTPATK